MHVTITGRHCEVPALLRAHAEERLASVGRFDGASSGMGVTLELDHGVHRVEVKLTGGAHATVAHGSGESFRAALDVAADRLERQLKRRHERQITRRRAAATAESPAD